jgi:hypothetical protein
MTLWTTEVGLVYESPEALSTADRISLVRSGICSQAAIEVLTSRVPLNLHIRATLDAPVDLIGRNEIVVVVDSSASQDSDRDTFGAEVSA